MHAEYRSMFRLSCEVAPCLSAVLSHFSLLVFHYYPPVSLSPKRHQRLCRRRRCPSALACHMSTPRLETFRGCPVTGTPPKRCTRITICFPNWVILRPKATQRSGGRFTNFSLATARRNDFTSGLRQSQTGG